MQIAKYYDSNDDNVAMKMKTLMNTLKYHLFIHLS